MITKRNKDALVFTLVRVFHLLAAVQFGFAIYYDYSHVHVPATVLPSNKTNYGGKFKFLTFIDGVNHKKLLALSYKKIFDKSRCVDFEENSIKIQIQ